MAHAEAASADTDASTFKHGGTRAIRANGASTRIVTLARGTLELAKLEQNDRVSLHASDTLDGAIRVDDWSRGHPELSKRTSDDDWRDAGVRKVRANGSSSVVTLTDIALERLDCDDRAELYQYAETGRIILVPALTDESGDTKRAPETFAAYVSQAVERVSDDESDENDDATDGGE